MTTTTCRAKNPARCPHHGFVWSQLDLSTKRFDNDWSATLNDNVERSIAYRFSLTLAEEQAIKDYAVESYYHMNIAMYDAIHKYGVPAVDSVELQREVDLLVGAIEKGEGFLREPRRLYRAAGQYDLSQGNDRQRQFSSLEEAAEFLKSKYAVGSEVHFESFTSTTEDPNALVDFTSPYDEETQNGFVNVVFEFQSKRGVPLSGFGQPYAHKEQEVLLAPGNILKVVGLHVHQNITFVNRLPMGDSLQQRLVTVVQLEEVYPDIKTETV